MPHLVELSVREPQPWRTAEVDGFSTADLHVDPLVAALDERPKLVDREEVLYTIAELLRHVTCVIGEGLRRVLGLPTAVLVLQRLRQIPVIQRGERLDARRLQLVDQAAVEVEPIRVGLTRAFGENARPRNGETI